MYMRDRVPDLGWARDGPRRSPATPRFVVPPALQSARIFDLPLEARPGGALERNGIQRLGDLDGWTKEDLLMLEQVGEVGAAAIVSALRRVGVVTDPAGAADPEAGSHRDVVERELRVTFASVHGEIPEPFRDVRLDELHTRRSFHVLEYRLGVRSLGDLASTPVESLSRIVGESGVEQLASCVGQLTAIDAERLKAITWPPDRAWPGFRLPRVDSRILAAVARAETFEAEVRATAAGMPERNARFFLARLPFGSIEPPTVRSLGESAGVSGSRVSQIARDRVYRFEGSGLRLPIACRLVEILDLEGGILGTRGFLRTLRERGVPQRRDRISALPQLARMGLVPPVEYRREHGIWLSETGVARCEASGGIDGVVRGLRDRARREYRRAGAGSVRALERDSPLRGDDLASVVTPAGTRLVSCKGYWIPRPGRDSSLVRAVEKTLAVTSPMGLQELHAGLGQIPRVAPLPPVEVLAAVLGAQPHLHVRGGYGGEVAWADGARRTRREPVPGAGRLPQPDPSEDSASA